MEEGMHVTKSGREIPIRELSDTHLENIIYFMHRKFRYSDCPDLEKYERELSIRSGRLRRS